MTLKERIYRAVRRTGKAGMTAFEAVKETAGLPQSVYPCFTALVAEGAILDSLARRKSPRNRNSIVWVDHCEGGVVPVWHSGHPTYSYRGQTKLVMDTLNDRPQTVPDLATKLGLEQMSLSSLMSRLCAQGWVRHLPTKKQGPHQRCYLFQLTPRGTQTRGDNH